MAFASTKKENSPSGCQLKRTINILGILELIFSIFVIGIAIYFVSEFTKASSEEMKLSSNATLPSNVTMSAQVMNVNATFNGTLGPKGIDFIHFIAIRLRISYLCVPFGIIRFIIGIVLYVGTIKKNILKINTAVLLLHYLFFALSMLVFVLGFSVHSGLTQEIKMTERYWFLKRSLFQALVQIPSATGAILSGLLAWILPKYMSEDV